MSNINICSVYSQTQRTELVKQTKKCTKLEILQFANAVYALINNFIIG